MHAQSPDHPECRSSVAEQSHPCGVVEQRAMWIDASHSNEQHVRVESSCQPLDRSVSARKISVVYANYKIMTIVFSSSYCGCRPHAFLGKHPTLRHVPQRSRLHVKMESSGTGFPENVINSISVAVTNFSPANSVKKGAQILLSEWTPLML